MVFYLTEEQLTQLLNTAQQSPDKMEQKKMETFVKKIKSYNANYKKNPEKDFSKANKQVIEAFRKLNKKNIEIIIAMEHITYKAHKANK